MCNPVGPCFALWLEYAIIVLMLLVVAALLAAVSGGVAAGAMRVDHLSLEQMKRSTTADGADRERISLATTGG